jgi:hypothetical protein
MKTTHRILLIASLVAGFASLSFAGPGLQYWQNSTPAIIPATNGPCDHMLAPNTGPNAHKAPVVSIQCTPELMKTDSLCQKNCGIKSAKPDANCSSMLVRNTNASRIPLVSVACTPELKANDAACQSHCNL